MARSEFVEIEVGAVSSKAELHAALAKSLEFPGWYGGNWDAFWDAITGLVEMPLRLRLVGWSSLQSRLPAEAAQLERALSEMSAAYPDAAAEVIYA